MMTVLVVEDDAMLGKALCTYLEKAGITVMWARRAEEVFEAVEAQTFNLILLDIMLPGADGYSILEQLKRDERFRRTPVVMLSNLSGEEDMERARRLGADDYIIKSNIEFESLVQMVKSKYETFQ